MHKVVVERPRWSPGRGKNGRRANLSDELLPKFEGIRRPHLNRKGLTDLLDPLRRWLHTQVGRPWNDVYSEACAVIKPDSVIRAHVKTHLLQFVERHTFMRDGEVWCFSGWWSINEMPVEQAGRFRASFYVHPQTGLLCEIPSRPRFRWRDKNAEHRALTQRWLNDTTLLRRLNGCWFECRMEKFPEQFVKADNLRRFDYAERKMICRSSANDLYGNKIYCTAKRQLSRRELQQFGLSNQMERSFQWGIALAC